MKIMPGHKPQKKEDFEGLAVIMLGLVMFRYLETFVETCCTSTKIRMKRSLSKAEINAAQKATARSAAFIGMAGPSTGVDRPTIEVLLINSIHQQQHRVQRVNLIRSPAEIRHSMMYKLGVPPSPHLSKSPAMRSPKLLADKMLRDKNLLNKGGKRGSRGGGGSGLMRNNSLSPRVPGSEFGGVSGGGGGGGVRGRGGRDLTNRNTRAGSTSSGGVQRVASEDYFGV